MEEAAARLARRREIVGDRIKEARTAKGLLQKELAGRVHVEPQTISNWERGVSTPDFDKLELLARELDQVVSFFLVGPEDVSVGDTANPASAAAIEEVLEQVAAVRKELGSLRELVEALRADLPRSRAAQSPTG